MPLCFFYLKKCVKYWLKLVMMEDNRYPKQCNMLLYRLDQAERKTWATHVRTLLYKFGFGYAWISQEVGNTVNFIRLFTESVKDCCKRNWHEKLNDSGKADLYRNYKTLLDTERYLYVDMPYILRKTFARFRCSKP